MYIPTSLGQAQGKANCSRWETDPESFSKVVAEHYVRTVPGVRSVLGLFPTVTRSTAPFPRSPWMQVVTFSNGFVVYVSFEKIPNFVAAALWYPKPAGPTRFYTYSCTPGGQLVLSERKKP
jgi:hypothetical protein